MNSTVKTSSFMLLYGAILGVLSAIFSFMLYTMDMHYQGGTAVSIISIVITLILITVSITEFDRIKKNGMQYSEGLKVGLGVAAVSSLIIVVFNIILTRVIDPETMNKAMEYQREQLIENTEFTIEQIDAQLELAKTFQSPIFQGSIGLFFGIFVGFLVTLLVLYLFGFWRLFKKAGFHGWEIFIPIYNLWILTKIVSKPGWWVILLLIPFVNIVFSIWLMNLLSKKFGKEVDFTIGLVLLPVIFIPILGMNESYYPEKING